MSNPILTPTLTDVPASNRAVNPASDSTASRATSHTNHTSGPTSTLTSSLATQKHIHHVPAGGGHMAAYIPVIDDNGSPHVVIELVCDALGIQPSVGVDLLGRRQWATIVPRTAQVAADPSAAPGSSTLRYHTCDVRTLLMWLGSIDERRVSPAIGPALAHYQAHAGPAIESYWTGTRLLGGSNGPGPDGSPAAGGARMDPQWLHSYTRRVVSRVMGDFLHLTEAPLPAA